MILTSPIDLHKHVDLGSVEGKTVLITGGANSDGIGFGVAEAMAENGYVLIYNMRKMHKSNKALSRRSISKLAMSGVLQ